MTAVGEGINPISASASRCESFSGHWSSLFGSLTDQKVSWHAMDHSQGLTSGLPNLSNPDAFNLSAAAHQSKAVAALFDDMFSSQSYGASLQQPQVASACTRPSSAASLCDSATSFSFKTALHTRSQAEVPLPTETQRFAALADKSSSLQPTTWGTLHDPGTDLCATLKDWQLASGAGSPQDLLQHTANSLSAKREHDSQGQKTLADSLKRDARFSVTARHGANTDSTGHVRLGHTERSAAASAVTRVRQASRQVRREVNNRNNRKFAQPAGLMMPKPWSEPHQAMAIADASAVCCHGAEVTASQALLLNLNKVAWWLDLQASQTISQQHSGAPAVASLPSVKPNAGQADLTNDFSTVCEPVLQPVQAAPAISTAAEDSPGPKCVFSIQQHADKQPQQQWQRQQEAHGQRAVAACRTQLPSASTELFLQLEAAAADIPGQGSDVGLLCPSLPPASPAAHAQPGKSDEQSALSGALRASGRLQLKSVHQLQLLQQQQDVEEDVYAGLERGGAVQTEATSSSPASTAAMMSFQLHASGADATAHSADSSDLPNQEQLTQGATPQWSGSAQQQQLGSSPQVQLQTKPIGYQQGLLDTALQGQPSIQPRGRPAPHPKAAEAPLVKQGSYAVAAKQAKHRSERQHKELQQLAAQRVQMRTVAGHKQALQADKPTQGKASHCGLLIGSYCQHATAHAAANGAASSAQGQPLKAMPSRPSMVMSANYRYASTLATEASSSCSEPETSAELTQLETQMSEAESQVSQPALSATGFNRQVPIYAEAGQSLSRRHGSVPKGPGSDAGRAESVSPQAGRLKRKAGCDPGRGLSPCSGLQAQLREQHPFKPLTAAVQQRHGIVRASQKSAAVQHEPGSGVIAQQQPELLLEQEFQRQQSLQRLDSQLGRSQGDRGATRPTTQTAYLSELESEAAELNRAEQQSAASRLPSPAQQSRLHVRPSNRQKPVKPAADSSQQVRPFGRAFTPRLKPVAKEPEIADRAVGRTGAAAANGEACPTDRPAQNSQGKDAGGRRRAKGKGSKQSLAADCKPVAPTAVTREDGDMSNSAEQQLLESSLARLDARLSNLAARCGGAQTPCSQFIQPGSISAPITRQPSSFLLPATSFAAPGHLPLRSLPRAAANGQSHALPTRAVDRRPDADFQLPELQQSPSVASAPCSAGLAKPRGRSGVHAGMPGAAKAALLARSRIPRAPLPPHSPQQQLQHQLQHLSHGPTHRPGTTSQPQGALSAATTQDLPLSPHAWQQQQQHQPMQNTHHSPYAARPPVMFPVAPPGLQPYMQATRMQQLCANGALSNEGPSQQGGAAAGSRHEGMCGTAELPWQGHARYQPQPEPSQSLQPGLGQQGHAQQMAAVAVASTAGAAAGASPWVQHAWYPALPRGYQLPLHGQQPVLMPQQHQPVMSMANAAMYDFDPAAIIQQQQLQQENMQAGRVLRQKPDGVVVAHAAAHQHPAILQSHVNEQLQSGVCCPGSLHEHQSPGRKPALHAKSNVLSAPTSSQKGVIRAYNLNALTA